MKTQAAIYHGGADVKVELREIDLEDPRDDELLVRLVATGICHTDIGIMQEEPFVPVPIVLGHEGAGIVERVGSAVTGFAPGDRVILSIDACGKCPSCHDDHPAYCEEMLQRHFSGGRVDGSSPLSSGGERLHGNFFAQSSFATYSVAPARAAIKVPEDVPLELMGPLGCGIQTGAGTVLNIFNAKASDSIVIFGVGTVGLAAVMAAKHAGCHRIIVSDLNTERLELAQELGATDVIKADEDDPVTVIQSLTNGRGVEYSFDTTGVKQVIRAALDCLHKNGTCAIAATFGDIEIDGFGILLGKTLRGTLEGDSNPQKFIPFLIDLYKKGELPLEKLVSFYPFSDINRALHDMHEGKAVKPILRMTEI